MKKILFFINSLSGGGAEKVLIDLLNMLDKSKYEIDLISVVGGVHKACLSKNVNCIALTKKFSIFSKILFKLPPRLFRKLFVRKKYDIEIAYLEGFPTKVIACGKKSKKIAFVHCDVSVKPVLQKIYKTHAECLAEYKKFDSMCFVSKKALEAYESTFGKLSNARVVHNVINAADVKSKSEENNDFDFHSKGLKIISVGRLSPEKGYERLIKIAGQLEKEYEFELCVLGDGPERKKLEGLIKELDIKSVRLLGFQKNPYNYMKKADLYVCTSFYEGYSTTVTECMILGIPVLTTDCAGMDEILDGGKYGIIVSNDETSLEQGIIGVLENHNIVEQLKLAIEENIVMSANRISTEEYDKLFEEVLQ